MPDNNQTLCTRLARHLEIISDWTGKIAAWMTLAIVVTIIIALIAKNFFSDSHFYGLYSIKLSQLVIYLFGMMFMTGIAYTFKQDQHVRVDVFYRSMSVKKQALVNFIGTLLFLIPICLVLAYYNTGEVISSWNNETSKGTGGIPYVYILKTFLIVMPVLLLIQGLATLLKTGQILFSNQAGQ